MPDQCELQEARFARVLQNPSVPAQVKDFYQAVMTVCPICSSLSHYADGSIEERARSPIALKVAAEGDISADGVERYMYWMKARSIPQYEAPFQKVQP